MDYKVSYQNWLNDDNIDDATKEELRALTDEKEIEDRFYQPLAFGTAGMRGVIAAGENRMNIYTVRRATAGVARFLMDEGEDAMKKGVAIAYDSRHMSKEFAEEVASVLSAYSIQTYLYHDIRPVPMISFAIRQLGCAAGIMITASHNPKQYNGYKVYGSHGGQMEPQDSDKVIDAISHIKSFGDIKTMELKAARESGLLSAVPQEVDEAYFKLVNGLVLRPEIFDQVREDFKVVYTPLHGSGRMPVLRAFEDAGVPGVQVVKEQEMPDGDFCTVKVPNPEEPDALCAAIDLAKACGADICMGTDPDCDRMGAAIRCQSDGSFMILTGNQIGCILLDYILNARKEKGTLPKNGAIIKTIVSTELATAMAESYDVTAFNVLTGFKYIAGLIGEFEKDHSHEYLFGFEESFGYMAGPFVRDKDAVQACLLMAEAAAWYKAQGLTPYEGLLRIYKQYGYYLERTISAIFEGREGADKMKAIMENLRKDIPCKLGPYDVIAMRDYKIAKRMDVNSGDVTELSLPESNVLYFELTDGGKFVMRPSGTEPKIKLYYGIKAKDEATAKSLLEELSTYVMKRYMEGD